MIFAAALGWSLPSTRELFDCEVVRCIGVTLCLAGLALLAWSLASFGQSFRVGIDTERPDKLVTTGIFAFSRNPIYGGFELILLGQFLISSSWLLLASLVAGYWLLHRQVLREKEFPRRQYGRDFEEYCTAGKAVRVSGGRRRRLRPRPRHSHRLGRRLAPHRRR